MDSLSLARSMRGSIGLLAMHWLFASSTTDKAVAAGMPADPMEAYAVGRFGVLGDCPVDNVVGAACFWEPDFLRAQVRAGRAVMAPKDGAAIFARLCQEWGAEHLAGFEGSDRLGELAERVVNAASPLGAPTFVGWRDQPLPPVGPGRTFQLCQTLRELGFARFSTALIASDMSPLMAIMSGPTGAWNAKLFGWPPPYPDGAPFAEARKAIEASANSLHAPDFDALTDDERDEFRTLAKAALAHASTKFTPASGAALPKD
jgi:hypothetical protein